MTLLHFALANPGSGPFWARMGYRPLLDQLAGTARGRAALKPRGPESCCAYISDMRVHMLVAVNIPKIC